MLESMHPSNREYTLRRVFEMRADGHTLKEIAEEIGAKCYSYVRNIITGTTFGDATVELREQYPDLAKRRKPTPWYTRGDVPRRMFEARAAGKTFKEVAELVGITESMCRNLLMGSFYADQTRGLRRGFAGRVSRKQDVWKRAGEIRARLAAGELGASIARDIGCSHQLVSQIKHGRVYKKEGA